MNLIAFLASPVSSQACRYVGVEEHLDTTNHVFIPLDCTVAVQVTQSGKAFYAGTAGRGEFIGLMDDLAQGVTVKNAVVQAGACIPLSRHRLAELCRENADFGQLILTHTLQAHADALKHAWRHIALNVEARLAGLLVDLFVKARRGEIDASHSLLANILCVRRAGVTIALHVLEGERAIRTARGKIQLRNASALRRLYKPSAPPIGEPPSHRDDSPWHLARLFPTYDVSPAGRESTLSALEGLM